MRLTLLFIFIIAFQALFAQDINVQDSSRNLSKPKISPSDSTNLTNISDSTKTAPASDIETTINYNSRDSMFFDIKSRKLFMYGQTHIDYGEISLDADRTNVNWEKRTIESDYSVDSTGRKIGRPVFSDGPEIYQTDDITYNFQTKRALIKGVVTEQEGAFMHGDNVKKNEDNELFIRGARYTTCNLDHPHFFIESQKLKVIPKNKVVSGPFNVKFRDLPTPLFFPFGMFPQPKKKSSGIVVPTYGEEQRRGFFLRDGGYYFGISDYVDLRLTGDIYSKGGNGLNITSNYLKRYSYRGTFNFSYNKSIDDNVESPLETNDYWIRWNHRPESRGNSSFSASVSAGSQSYNSNNNLVNQDFTRAINAQFTSSISYTKKFQGTPFNISTNLRHNQNIQTGLTNLTLPDFTLNTNRQYPFKGLVKSSKSPLAKLNFSHNFVAKNELTNRAISGLSSIPVANVDPTNSEIIPFNANNFDRIVKRSQVGGKHSIPISTSLSLFKFFTLNPSFSYQELWYTKELRYTYLEDQKAVQVDTLNGFSRAGSWSASTSLNTRIYGTKFFKSGKIQAIRHVMTPSISFAYSPDFSDPKYGVYSDVQIDSLGNTTNLSKFQGFAYGSPPGGESKTIGMSLSNNIEMKVASKKDTITGFKKIKIFDNIGLASGYNLAKDSFQLNDITVSARTSLLNNLISINFNGTIDPYIRDPESDVQINRLAWNSGQGLGQLTSLTTAIGMNLSPGGLKGDDKSNNGNATNPQNGLDAGLNDPFGNVEGLTYEEERELDVIRNNPDLYVNFNVPWTLRMNYSISRSKVGSQEATVRQSLNFSGTLGLTEKTQITFNSGYDFEEKDFTTSRLGITRDLHCWTMDFNWVPFGRYQSYFVSIRVKSSLLQDLKVEKRRNFLDFFN